MRLGTCIALELAVVASCVGGVLVGVSFAREAAGEYLEMRPAEAAPAISMAASVEIALPRATFVEPPPPPPAPLVVESVYGAPDAELLAPVGQGKVTKIKLNHGGTSLSIRVDFESGARASFKPEQIHPQSDPRREIAAYRLDRLLRIGRVPPAKAFTVSVADLLAAAEPGHRSFISRRLADEALAKNGVLRGELSWWVPEIKLAKLGPHRIDEKEGKAAWIAALKLGATIPEGQRDMIAQISAVVLFDVLIDNPDRWTGANTVTSPDGKTLLHMDNTMSFSRLGFGHRSNLLTLRRTQVFPKGLVERIRALTPEAIAVAVNVGEDGGLAPLLHESELAAILVRRDNMLRYIDQLIAEHGEAAVLAFP
ncbi:MAG: hypothetical protein ACKV2T_27985 [Kofleriaceae bacterium]